MLFNSVDYFVFLIVILFAYYKLNHKWRWLLLLAASYFFYGVWKVEFLGLILFSTTIDYLCGIGISQSNSKKKRKWLLWLSLFSNLSILYVFKYLDFSITAVNDIFSQDFVLYNLVLPMGISFYTFQTMSYSIDVYKGDIKAEKHFGYFALYVTFFPQLVAGPIERASRLLPQLKQKVEFNWNNISDGLKMVLIGLFKKVVIADRIAQLVNEVYNNQAEYNGAILIIATVGFAIQIYCDFSGYSDIAIGSARMLGVNLMDNFKTPYFSKSLQEFWTRWHISLSQWFRDYVYIPLGGSKVVKWRWRYNLLITFLVSGFWHGANWTFIVWGGIHGVILILEKIKVKQFSYRIYKIGKMLFVFSVVCFAWIFFRANSMSDAIDIIHKMMTSFVKNGLIADFKSTGISLINTIILLYAITILFVLDWLNFQKKKVNNEYIRLFGMIVLLFSILTMGVTEVKEFIYFQF